MIPADRLRAIIADAETATVAPWYLSVCREVLTLREQRDKVLALHRPPCDTFRALDVTEEADR